MKEVQDQIKELRQEASNAGGDEFGFKLGTMSDKLKELVDIGRASAHKMGGICFPEYIIYKKTDKGDKCVGFLMKCHKGDVLGQSILAPNIIKEMVDWTRVELASFAIKMLKKFICLHEAGILMADINPSIVNTLAETCSVMRFSIPFYEQGVQHALEQAMNGDDRLNLRHIEDGQQAAVLIHEWLKNKGE